MPVEVSEAKALTTGKIAGGVLLGNLMTAGILAVAYGLFYFVDHYVLFH